MPTPVDVTHRHRDRNGEGRSRRERIRTWGPILVLVVVPALLVSLQVRAFTKLSPIDELQHIDYMFRSPGLHQVVAGTKDSAPALREEACRGIDAVFTPPPCDSKVVRPDEFQENGYNTEYVQPPTYYDITWTLGEIVKPLSGAKSWVTIWRLLGALWLSAGLVLTYLAGLRFGVSRLPLLGLLVLAASAPALLFSSSTVNNDAASVAVGGAGLYLIARWEEAETRWRWLILVAIGVLGTVIKVQNIVIVLVIIGYLLFRALDRVHSERVDVLLDSTPSAGARHRLARTLIQCREVRAAGVIAVSSLVVAGAWVAIQAAYQLIDPNLLSINIRYRVNSISPDQVGTAFGIFLTPLSTPTYIPTRLISVWTLDMASVLTWVLTAGVILGAVIVTRDRRITALSRASLLVTLLGGPLFVILYFVVLHQYGVIPVRYGFSLIPALIVCTAAAIRARWVRVGAVAVSFIGVGFAVLQLA